ncbi:MAG: hypothetical protein CMD05_06655, partial [Flavobacteriales bacterium]|nr:hypothetical protein [Flavobacteriales bacterium]
FLFSFSSFAQVEVEQGTVILEMGTNGFSTESINSWEGLGGMPNATFTDFVDVEFDDKYDKYTQSSFAIDFKTGFAVSDGLVLGIGFNYVSTSSDVEYSNDWKDWTGDEDYDESSNQLTLVPMLRYYFAESGVWSQIDYSIWTTSSDHSEGYYDDEEFPKRNALGFSAGYAASLNDYVSLNPYLKYSLITQTTKDDGYDKDGDEIDEVIKSGKFNIGIALTVHLGY